MAPVFDGIAQISFDDHAHHNRAGRLFGESIAADLKRRDVIDVLDEISDGVSGIQANRCHSLISAVCKWGQREDIITDDLRTTLRSEARRSSGIGCSLRMNSGAFGISLATIPRTGRSSCYCYLGSAGPR